MTVAQSLKLQGRSVLSFLIDACHAHAPGIATPTLLPATQ
jgi:hypothetical protein